MSPADDVEALLSEAEDLRESETLGFPPTAAPRATAQPTQPVPTAAKVLSTENLSRPVANLIPPFMQHSGAYEYRPCAGVATVPGVIWVDGLGLVERAPAPFVGSSQASGGTGEQGFAESSIAPTKP